jgi:class 3 adenylate cyclase
VRKKTVRDVDVAGKRVFVRCKMAPISGLTAPGEVLVSDTVRGLARTSAGVTFEDRGEQALKGIDDPVRVFAVRQA